MNESGEIPSKFEDLTEHQQSRVLGGAYEIGRAAFRVILDAGHNVPSWLRDAVHGIIHRQEKAAYTRGVEEAHRDMEQEEARQAKENPEA